MDWSSVYYELTLQFVAEITLPYLKKEANSVDQSIETFMRVQVDTFW